MDRHYHLGGGIGNNLNSALRHFCKQDQACSSDTLLERLSEVAMGFRVHGAGESNVVKANIYITAQPSRPRPEVLRGQGF